MESNNFVPAEIGRIVQMDMNALLIRNAMEGTPLLRRLLVPIITMMLLLVMMIMIEYAIYAKVRIRFRLVQRLTSKTRLPIVEVLTNSWLMRIFKSVLQRVIACVIYIKTRAVLRSVNCVPMLDLNRT